MIPQTATPTQAPLATQTSPATAKSAENSDQDLSDFSFGSVLHALNPLQYVPVLGTLYRAITGDTQPEPVQAAGSMVVGGLIGGPVGIAISGVSSLLQHITGIHLDDVAHDAMVSLGLLDETPAAPAVAMPTNLALAAYGQTMALADTSGRRDRG